MKRIIGFIVILVVILGGIFIMSFYSKMNEYYSGGDFCNSIQEAQKKKVFVACVDISPQQLNVTGKTIEFGESWIEWQKSYVTKLFFFKEWKDTGDYWLRFNLKTSLLNNNYFFVIEDEDGSISQNSDKVFSKILDNIEVKSFKVSLIKGWKQPRDKNITFTIN